MLIQLLRYCAILQILFIRVNFSDPILEVRCPWLHIERDEKCKPQESSYGFANLPILTGVYCFNNGSGLCKLFSGRFELFFNSFTDEIIGTAPQSKYVNEYGLHERIPVSYNINGDINYADRSINWAEKYVRENNSVNLLSVESFNWCAYTVGDYWPYKSAIIYDNRFHIYFYNGQSCIYDTKTNKRQHYNTRFMHNSRLRMDLDPNPTIFAMENNMQNRTNLVKHFRQHYYEQKFSVLENPTKDVDFFVLMEDIEDTSTLKLNGQRPLIPYTSLIPPIHPDPKSQNMCINEYYTKRSTTPGAEKNSRIVPLDCGLDPTESANKVPSRDVVYAIHLHGLPRQTPEMQQFFQVNVTTDYEWEQFAEDGLSIIAVTTIPLGQVINVIMLGSYHHITPKDTYDENYPMPFYMSYLTEFDNSTKTWLENTPKKRYPFTKLNQVDDIEYLPKCNKILVIFGPLYTEMPADPFDINASNRVGSIKSLSIYELATAFFVDPDTDSLWVYHRFNWIEELKYTCGSGDQLVTAKKTNNKYERVEGIAKGIAVKEPMLPEAAIISRGRNAEAYMFEEEFWWHVGRYQPIHQVLPEAPNPDNYPLGDAAPPGLEDPSIDTWLVALIAVAILIMVAMCIICLTAIRRRRKRGEGWLSVFTNRSDLSGGHLSSEATRRSSRLGNSMMPTGSKRSGLSSRAINSLPKLARSSKATKLPLTLFSVSNRTNSSRSLPTSSRSGRLSKPQASGTAARERSHSSSSGKRSPRFTRTIGSSTVRSPRLFSSTKGKSSSRAPRSLPARSTRKM